MHSLRTKIALLAIWIAVFSVAVITTLSVVFIRNTGHRKSDQLLLLLCETGERNLDYYFSSVERSVKGVASFTERDLDGTGDEELAAHMERVREYFDRIAAKTNGVLTYYYRIDPAVSSAVKGFWYTNLDGRSFAEHEVTDITLYDTEDTGNLVWFTVPKYEGRPIWLPPYITDNLDVRVVSYNYPIYYRGQFIGVIGIEIDYTTMKEQVQSIHLYDNGYAFLTDADGGIIYHPYIDMATLTEETAPAVPEGLLDENTFIYYTYDGVEKEAAWLRMSNGMRLYVSVPVIETEGEWRQLIRNVLIASVAVLVIAVILTQLVTRRITRPIKELTRAAKQTEEGNYDFSLSYKGNDEVDALTKSFLRMASKMKEHIIDLNKRVYVDALTSVRNKGAYTTYIEEMQNRMAKDPGGTEFAIGIFDCDDLKSVNDIYGHEKGDIYLKTASRLICRIFQHSPVFRIGGDEFAVVLQGDDYRNRADLLDEFDRASAESRSASGNIWEQVHVSVGLTVFDPARDSSVIDTMRRADNSMYENKRRNKNPGGRKPPEA